MSEAAGTKTVVADQVFPSRLWKSLGELRLITYS